jgi:photosystem II stability/assembly factor-like uncharacterized protein
MKIMERWTARAILALCACCVFVPAWAKVTTTEVTSGIPHQALFSVAFDGKNGIAVGARAQIMTTMDGGESWNPEQSTEKLSLFGAAISGTQMIAVGQMGLILRKEADGPWTRIESGTEERLMGVALNAKGNAVVVGSFGTILMSKDSGKSWRKGSPDWTTYFAANAAELGDGFAPHLYGVQIDGENRTTIVGEVGLVLRSMDCGDAWLLLHRGDFPGGSGRAELSSLDLLPDGRGYAVGQRGIVFKTTDGGASWAPVDVGSTANLLGVVVAQNGDVTITAMREVVTSRDNGATWQKVDAVDVRTGWYSGVAMNASDQQIYAVGHSGRIIKFGR